MVSIPIKNHFEQEENARLMGYKYEDIFELESIIEDKITTAKVRPSVNGTDQNGVSKGSSLSLLSLASNCQSDFQFSDMAS